MMLLADQFLNKCVPILICVSDTFLNRTYKIIVAALKLKSKHV